MVLLQLFGRCGSVRRTVSRGTAMRFTKMHSAGNDFVVIDRRAHTTFEPSEEVIRGLGDRHRGIGFDQLMLIEPCARPATLAGYRIWNADGSAAEQCGNGARCVVAWLRRERNLGAGTYRLDAPTGPATATIAADGRIEIDLGRAEFSPPLIPFTDAVDDAFLHRLLLPDGAIVDLGVANLGNPHALLEVKDVAAADVAGLGRAIGSHRRFPDRANVGFAAIVDRHTIDLRVCERGVGETLACGSGAAAAAAILERRGLVESPVAVRLPGGTLTVRISGAERLWLSGPTAFVFDGILAE